MAPKRKPKSLDTIEQLVPAPYNPRRIKPKAAGGLGASLKRYGDLSGITWNSRTGHVVAGHQRLAQLQAQGVKLEAGALHTASGGTFPVRVVDWPVAKEKAANVAANNPAISGEFDDGLGGLLSEIRIDIGADEFGELCLDDLARSMKIDLDPVPGGADPIFPDKKIAQAAFEYFRKAGFPYRRLALHEQMQEINALRRAGGESSAGYQVADTYHPHRFHGHALGMKSPIEAFGDDGLMRRGISKTLGAGRRVGTRFVDFWALVSGTQACSNFRPAAAMGLCRRFCRPGGDVLDPCMGYGGRLVGWFAAQTGGRYIGTDPSTRSHAGNVAMATALGFLDQTDMRCEPFEDADLGRYRGAVDFVMTSPPYFAKEVYADEPTQSARRYENADQWQMGFLRPLAAKCFSALAPGCAAAINIADVKIKGKAVPLPEMTESEFRRAGFGLEALESFQLSVGKMTGRDEAMPTEPMFIFRKPSTGRSGSAKAKRQKA